MSPAWPRLTMGEFDLDVFDNKALKLILALFIFIVVVVLLNVLIAIVSNSHDSIDEKTAAGLFYRSRLEYITETTPVVHSSCFQAIAKCLKLTPTEDKHTIKKRLEEALEQHKDDVAEDDSDSARLSAIRESEQRTKKDLADTNQKLAAMEKKIDELLRAQGLPSDDAKTVAPGTSATDEASHSVTHYAWEDPGPEPPTPI